MEIAIIVVLGIICLAQIIERYLFSQKMLEQLSNAQKAVFSRNINEYLSATTPPTKKDEGFTENDEIDMADLPDKEFDEFIAKQNQK